MIGWKCNYGWFLSTSGKIWPTSLSDITFTDVGRPFTIVTHSINFEKYNGVTDNISTKVVGVYYDSIVDFQNALEGLIGNDFSSLYTTPVGAGSRWNSGISVPTQHIPSIGLACPNLFSFATTTPWTINHFRCCYIPSLKKVIVNNNIFTVTSDGSLVNTGSFTLAYPPSYGNGLECNTTNYYYARFLCAPFFDGTKESFWEHDQYCIQVTLSDSTHKIGVNKSTPSSNSVAVNFWKSLFSDYVAPDIDVPDNPYEPGGDSGEGGGGGSFDDDSDPIPDSSLPTISSANTGFTRIYNPSLSQVQDLARYLWTDDTVIETIWNHIKQFFENPMEAIIGFNLVPCAVPNGGTKNFALMYIDTGVQMTVAANQFVDVDCGTLEIKEYFGSALDYSPYTKISCFLPFIGTVQLNTDEVMKSTLQVKYRIDICSGSCVAKILVGGSVLYQYSGHCAIPIPISAADFSSYVSAAVSVAKLAIGAAVGGGMGALMAGADNPAQQTNQVVTTTQTTETGRNPATGRQITLGTKTTVETRESPANQSSTQASFSGIAASNISNTVGQIITSKPHVEHSGSFSGNTGYLGVRRPYVIIQRPNMCMPAQYQQFNGFPAMITETLSSLKGFTRVQQVQLTEMSATNPEQAEILELLKSGVII